MILCRFPLTGLFAALAAAIALAAAAAGAELRLLPPEGITVAPNISIYEARGGEPVLRLEDSWSAKLPAGGYLLGVGDYPARLARFDVPSDGEVALNLAAVSISAPDGVSARYAVLSAADGSLIAPLVVPATLLLPAGTYRLRRDLGSEEAEIVLTPGQTLSIDLGAVVPVPAAGAADWPLLALEKGQDLVTASTSDLSEPLALVAGEYEITASPDVRPVPIEISPGETVNLPIPVAHILGNGAPLPLDLRDGEGNLIASVPSGWSGRMPLAGVGGPIEVEGENSAGGSLAISMTEPTVLWRLSDGTMPQFDGLTLKLDPEGPSRLVPGAEARILVETLSPVEADVTLSQGDAATRHLGRFSFATGSSVWLIAIPEDVDSETPATLAATVTGEGGLRFNAQSLPLDVHAPLLAGVRNLQVADTSATTITLTWSAPPDSVVAGYNVYRGVGNRPLNGAHPVVRPRYSDIGLSANRGLIYRVCAVDEISLEGPCVEVEAATSAAQP